MFKLYIHTNNDAFASDDAGEVATILRRVVEALECGTRDAFVYDTNGNRVGRFDLTEEA